MKLKQTEGSIQNTRVLIHYPTTEELHISNLMKRIIRYQLPLSRWCTKFKHTFNWNQSFYIFKKHERYNYGILQYSSEDFWKQIHNSPLLTLQNPNQFLSSKLICNYQEFSKTSQQGFLMKIPNSMNYLSLRDFLIQSSINISELLSIFILLFYCFFSYPTLQSLSIDNVFLYKPPNLQENELANYLQINFQDYGIIYIPLSRGLFIIPHLSKPATSLSIFDEMIQILRKHKNYTGKKDKITLIAYLISWWNQNNQDVQQIRQQPIYFLLKLHELGMISCKLPSFTTLNLYSLGINGIHFQKTITTEQTKPELAYHVFKCLNNQK